MLVGSEYFLQFYWTNLVSKNDLYILNFGSLPQIPILFCLYIRSQYVPSMLPVRSQYVDSMLPTCTKLKLINEIAAFQRPQNYTKRVYSRLLAMATIGLILTFTSLKNLSAPPPNLKCFLS